MKSKGLVNAKVHAVFDMINHTILIKKLPHLAFNIDALRWIENYLVNRKQLTIANNIKAPLLTVSCVVPQGSTLLFLLYINDIGKTIKHSNYLLYADDTVLYTSEQDLTLANQYMNADHQLVQRWCKDNSLTVNTKKTKVMFFSLNKNLLFRETCHCSLSNQPLEVVDTYKYLGITLDTHLTYKPHIKNIITKVTHKLSVLSKIRKYLDVYTSRTIFKSMILPHFDYGDVVYAGASQESLSDLQILQNKCLRLCTSSPYDINIIHLHNIAKVSLLAVRRNTHLLNLMYQRKDNVDYIDNRTLPTPQHLQLPSRYPLLTKLRYKKVL